jgi:hypothetical protein
MFPICSFGRHLKQTFFTEGSYIHPFFCNPLFIIRDVHPHFTQSIPQLQPSLNGLCSGLCAALTGTFFVLVTRSSFQNQLFVLFNHDITGFNSVEFQWQRRHSDFFPEVQSSILCSLVAVKSHAFERENQGIRPRGLISNGFCLPPTTNLNQFLPFEKHKL